MKEFDNIIIGTGMGGGVLGYALAKEGNEVLFCEKGLNIHQDTNLIYDHFAEEIESINLSFNDLQKEYARYGRFMEPLKNKANKESLLPTLGSITGGSTSLYGMVLERFFPTDFSPELWPISFFEIEKFYQQAEELFQIRGTQDPLKKNQTFHYKAPGETHAINKTLMAHLESKKMNPYILPKAYDNVQGCQTCQSYLCSKNCKNDVNKICLEPANQKYQAQILSNTEVLKLITNKNRVTSIIIKTAGQESIIKGKRFFLAAGALGTPKILLNSKSEEWPNGLANSSQLVGKYLMRHLVDLYSLSLAKDLGCTNSLKEIGFNDLYCFENLKLGNVQSFGALPSNQAIINDLYRKLKLNGKNISAKLWLHLSRYLDRPMNALTKNSTLLAATLEDHPYEQNQVTVDFKGNIQINYKIQSEEKHRLKIFRKMIKDIFKDFDPQTIKLAHKNEMLAHACGTCRFGIDPKLSVLNKYNQTHDIENLYIVDASFFPTSGGTNPALTIAANALRVADYIMKGH